MGNKVVTFTEQQLEDYQSNGVRGPGDELSVSRPPTIWSDDLVKIAVSRWMRKAQDRSEWRALGEAYVQQWTSFG
ncbi:hypothetical protein MSG28_010696 [Choristoneura fumiferana]|uniref:Uncharacterized protein n=1 Tax=Choristoneura fumiferana TaxID=7141 RepID=A0ACC0KNP2_CHOFU|nr:hypothetical protein MSG28_010696 [Choristoneura fumiferana]